MATHEDISITPGKTIFHKFPYQLKKRKPLKSSFSMPVPAIGISNDMTDYMKLDPNIPLDETIQNISIDTTFDRSDNAKNTINYISQARDHIEQQRLLLNTRRPGLVDIPGSVDTSRRSSVVTDKLYVGDESTTKR